MRRSISLATAVLVGGLLLSSCSDSGSEDGGFQVTSEVVSHEATKDMLVFAPDAEGSWPVIVAFHGIGGTPEDMAEIATRRWLEKGTWCSPDLRDRHHDSGGRRPGWHRCRMWLSPRPQHRGRLARSAERQEESPTQKASAHSS